MRRHHSSEVETVILSLILPPPSDHDEEESPRLCFSLPSSTAPSVLKMAQRKYACHSLTVPAPTDVPQSLQASLAPIPNETQKANTKANTTAQVKGESHVGE